MLVLSRRAQQQVVFPHLGIRVNVLQVKGRLVRLGIEAPDSVKILRNELNLDADESHRPAACSGSESGLELNHQQRNDLNVLHLRLAALQRKIESGQEVDAQQALDGLLNKFSAIDHEFDAQMSGSTPRVEGRPVSLLVVEDSDNERKLMAYLLADRGFNVQVARDGQEAIEQLKGGASLPDFVLMDMQMPVSNGMEALLQIRSDDNLRHLKVFAVTGMSRDHQSEPVAHGWDGWFQKPLDVAALMARLSAEDLIPAREIAV